jgi:hypothetical protein
MFIKEDVKVAEFSDEELREAIQLIADRLGFKFQRQVTPDYTDISMIGPTYEGSVEEIQSSN